MLSILRPRRMVYVGFVQVLVSLLFVRSAAADPGVSFEHVPGKVKIAVAGRPFATYVYEDERIPRPYFQDLRAPDGTRLTRPNPPVEGRDLTDHSTFHPGLWMAFGDLNGADFWRVRDRVQHAHFERVPQGGPHGGGFTVINRYEKGEQLIAEERHVVSIEQVPAGTLLLWDSTFRPLDAELVFGDQEEMGLGLRMDAPLIVQRGGRITNSHGGRDEAQVWGKTADWCAYEGPAGDNRVGLLLVPDPANFRPSWFHARDYGLLAANPFGRQAFTKGEPSRVVVKPGESLRLRFAVLAYARPSTAEPTYPADFKAALAALAASGLDDGKRE